MDFNYNIVILAGILACSKHVFTVRLTIQPNPLVVGGNDVTLPTTSPQEVVFECSPEGTGNINGVYSLYMKRANNIFAEITTFESAKLSDNAPSDIRTKNPTIEGNLDTITPTNSVLRVKFLTSRLTCTDEETFSCQMFYKPYNSESLTVSNDQRLTLTYLPGNFEMTASRLVNNFPMQIMNQSTVQYNDDLEYRCTGNIGKTSALLITWYMHDQTSGMFGVFVPSDVGQSIDNGQPSVSVCPYSRTSTLRYRVTTNDRQNIVFRCGVSTQTTTGALHTSYSLDFTLTPPVYTGSGCQAFYTPLVHTVLLTFSACIVIIMHFYS